MKILAGLAAAAGLFFACGTASAQSLVEYYDEDVLTEIVEDMGYEVVEQAGSDDEDGPYLIVADEDSGGVFGFQGKVCDDDRENCLGILIYGALDLPEDEDDLLEIMNEYNADHSPAKMLRDEDGLALTRYMIMDDGISRRNLEVNIEVFTELYFNALEDLE